MFSKWSKKETTNFSHQYFQDLQELFVFIVIDHIVSLEQVTLPPVKSLLFEWEQMWDFIRDEQISWISYNIDENFNSCRILSQMSPRCKLLSVWCVNT